MFKNLFKPKPIDFVSPMTGTLIAMEEVPDPVFSSKSVGDGFAIQLLGSHIVSCVDGEVVAIFPTKHAIGLKGIDRNEYLIHIGLDSVNLNGEGFDCHVNVGDKVKKGDLLLTIDREVFEQKNINLISPVVVTNLNGRRVKVLKSGEIKQGEPDVLSILV